MKNGVRGLTIPKIHKKSHGGFFPKFGSVSARCAYLLVLCALVLTVLLSLGIAPQRYDLQVGDIAMSTITASKDVIDEIETEARRSEAASRVEPTYVYKPDVADEIRSDLSRVLSEVKTVQAYGHSILEKKETSEQASYSFTEDELKYARAKITSLEKLTDYQLRTILRSNAEDIETMCTRLTSAVENMLNSTIREGYERETIQSLQQIVGYQTPLNLQQNVVPVILNAVIQPNMVIDQEATEKLRQEARDQVEPVVYKQGQNIVLAREVVTANQLEMLRSLGLLDKDTVDVALYIGGLLMVLLSLGMLVISLLLFCREIFDSPKRLLVLLLNLCLTTGLCVAARLVNTYLMPVLLGAMLSCCLLGTREAVATVPAMAMLVNGLILGSDTVNGTANVNLLLTALVSGVLCIVILRKKPYRMQILLSGVLAALSNALLILTVAFMTEHSLDNTWSNMLTSAAGTMISALLCIGLEPAADAVFRLATPSKLLELSNPNHPLLRRLMLEAPGTYHHSIVVANLSEAAAEAIGASPLLARAGAYFHDIGKLKRPQYFKENQMGENPHDRTNPFVSAAIVTAHTRDGLQMAQQARLPREICDIITEHHGDTPVMFFYHKALQAAEGEPVDIVDFRYDGRHPHTRESAIIMLADTVEAAVRSMQDPTPDKIQKFIRKLVQGKLDDGQLSDAPVTLGDITKICDAFATVLNGVFHERIEYPDMSPSAAAHVSSAKQSRLAESPVEEKELKPVEETGPEQPEQSEQSREGQPDRSPSAAACAGSAKQSPREDATPVQQEQSEQAREERPDRRTSMAACAGSAKQSPLEDATPEQPEQQEQAQEGQHED